MSMLSGPTVAGAAELSLAIGAAEQNWHSPLDDLPRSFQDTVARAPAKALGAILSLASEKVGAVAAAVCQPGSDGRLLLSHIHSPAGSRAATDRLLSDLMAAARWAVANRTLRWTGSGGAREYLTLSAPVICCDRPAGAIVFLLSADCQPSEKVAAVALYAAAWICLASTTLAASVSASPSEVDVGPVYRICAQATACADMTAAFAVLAGELQSWLGCDKLCIAVPRGLGGARVAAISKVSTFDRRSALVGAFEAASRETILVDRPLAFPAASGSPPANILGELCRQAASPKARSWPCHDAEGNLVCVCVALLPDGYDEDDPRFSSVGQWSDDIGSAVRLLRQGHEGILQRLLRTVPAAVRRLPRGRYLALSAAAAGLVMCAPWPYHLSCECIVEPVMRRVVCAPFDGILDRTLVRPGDRVHKGDQLAIMDGRELTLQIASRQALLDQARQRHTAALAKRDAATAQFATLELQQLEQEVGLLKRRQENLAVRSPLDGIVVSGDLHRVEGVPLAVGQKLFEVASLDRMVVEASVPEHEITGVAEGQSVAISLESHSGVSLPGTLLRLHPQAEIREHKSVFVAEIEFDTSELSPLPGMSGQAQIEVGSRPIGWILFHRPWHYLRSKLLW